MGSSGWLLGVCMGLSNVLGYAFVLLVSRSLGPADFGAFSAVNNTAIFLSLPASAFQVVVAAHQARGHAHRSGIGLSLVVGGTLALLTVALAPFVAHAFHLGSPAAMVLVALMLIAWVAFSTGWGSISADHIVPLMLSGVIGIFMGDTALFLTLNRMGPRRTAMLFSLNAPMSAILGWLLLNEDLTVTQILGILITFSGVLLAIRFGKRKSQLHQWESVRGPLWAGVLLGLAAALSQSIGSLIARPVMETGADPVAAAHGQVGHRGRRGEHGLGLARVKGERRPRRQQGEMHDRPGVPRVGQHELAQAMLVSDAAVSRMLTALVPEGLVTVEPDPEHARRRLVRLTEKGAERFHASSTDYATQLEKALTARDFPYERYLRDSIALRDFLATAAGRG